MNIKSKLLDRGVSRFVSHAVAVLVLLGSIAVNAVSAQTDKTGADQPTARTHPENPMLWDTETMMNEAVDQISRRYNLNDQQKQYTKLFLVTRVRAFLDEHEQEVRELLQESIEMRTGARASDPIALKVWAERAMPLYEKASQEILHGNEEWAEILDDDQKKIHDRDMELMRRSFENATETMAVWKDGKGKLPPVAKTTAGNNPTTVNSNQDDVKKDGQLSDSGRTTISHIEDNWEAYVNLFIDTYNLEGKDAVSAREKIHKEMFNNAKRYRQLRAKEFEELETMKKQSPKNRKMDIHQILEKQKKLESPIREFFVEMDQRLKQLPTAEQKANAKVDQKDKLDTWYKTLSGESIGRKSSKSRSDKASRRTSAKDEKAKEETPKTESSPEKSKEEGETKEPETKKTEEKPVEKPAEKPADKPSDEKKSDD